MGLIESMSGKICGHSDMYFFRKNGKVFSGKICNPSAKEPTASQLAQRTKFATARANAKTALADPDQKAASMKKSLLQLILATAMCIFGCALLVAGLALPPAGIIDSSLLVAYGETLTFAGALIGVDYHYRYRPKK